MDAHLPRLEEGMTARDRMKHAFANCGHRSGGICRDCCTVALIAHAKEVRDEAVKRIDIFQDIVGWQPGESRNALIWEIEQSVGIIEVS